MTTDTDIIRQLRNVLYAFLTDTNINEDKWNRPTFDQACVALAAADAHLSAAPADEPSYWGSGDGYWVRAEDKLLRPDAQRFTLPFYAAPQASKPAAPGAALIELSVRDTLKRAGHSEAEAESIARDAVSTPQAAPVREPVAWQYSAAWSDGTREWAPCKDKAHADRLRSQPGYAVRSLCLCDESAAPQAAPAQEPSPIDVAPTYWPEFPPFPTWIEANDLNSLHAWAFSVRRDAFAAGTKSAFDTLRMALRNAWAGFVNLSSDMEPGPLRQQMRKHAAAIDELLTETEQSPVTVSQETTGSHTWTEAEAVQVAHAAGFAGTVWTFGPYELAHLLTLIKSRPLTKKEG